MGHLADSAAMGDARNDDDAPLRLVEWFAAQGADLPWRRTRDRYAILVAEIQLQATPVARVLAYYEPWMTRWPTACDLANESLGEVLAAWQGLGYPRRARNLQAACRVVCDSGWPERLTDLPGVGPYTAAAVRCFADEDDVLPVDTNVARVIARRFPHGWPGTPSGRSWHIGQALMDLGRLYCTARSPRCDQGCPVRTGCAAADDGRAVELTPARRPQGRYEGSMRQRRGRLLAALAVDGATTTSADEAAAESLVREGLARREGALLVRAD